MYRQFNIHQFHVLPTLNLCVFCGSENKQRLFPYTALTDWFVQPRRSVFTARYGLGLISHSTLGHTQGSHGDYCINLSHGV